MGSAFGRSIYVDNISVKVDGVEVLKGSGFEP